MAAIKARKKQNEEIQLKNRVSKTKSERKRENEQKR